MRFQGYTTGPDGIDPCTVLPARNTVPPWQVCPEAAFAIRQHRGWRDYLPAGLSGWDCASEAMYLMMRHVFDELGYRRYAWQCNSLNARSQAAATRLGFKFEGVWPQANVHKGRNRVTAWFSIPDSKWPAIKIAFEHGSSQKILTVKAVS